MVKYRIVSKTDSPYDRCVGTLHMGCDSGFRKLTLKIARGHKKKQEYEMFELLQDLILTLNNNKLKVEKIK